MPRAWFVALLGATGAGLAVLPFLIIDAPPERTMGLVQKIMYFHVPCAWVLLISTMVCAVASLIYLLKNSAAADRVAHAAGELGALFGLCVMTTGPLWGRKSWGTYWQWDARLTTSLLLWLTLLAYLIARRYGGMGANRLAAAVGLFAGANAPLVYASTRLWRTLHPNTSVVFTMAEGMYAPFLSGGVVMLLLWLALLFLRVHVFSLRARLDALSTDLDDLAEADR
jgi:heme exporter protein C